MDLKKELEKAAKISVKHQRKTGKKLAELLRTKIIIKL